METYNDKQFLNIGTGEDVTIKELTEIIAKTVGYSGSVVWDTTKPDGTPRKLLNVEKLHNLGWRHKISLKDGVEKTYNAFLEELSAGILRGQ
jgi:GDP-L-fucose synthase